MCGDFTWIVFDCEELVRGYSQEMMGLVLVLVEVAHQPGIEPGTY